MRFSVIIAIILFPYYHSVAQQLLDLEKHKAVLLADTVKLDFTVDSLANRFTPTKSEAVAAEEILLKHKQLFVKKWGTSFNKTMRRSNRQFVGYYDIKGDKHVLMFLLDMTRPRADYYFKTWLIKPVVGFGEFYERNLKILNVNLSKQNARIF